MTNPPFLDRNGRKCRSNLPLSSLSIQIDNLMSPKTIQTEGSQAIISDIITSPKKKTSPKKMTSPKKKMRRSDAMKTFSPKPSENISPKKTYLYKRILNCLCFCWYIKKRKRLTRSVFNFKGY